MDLMMPIINPKAEQLVRLIKEHKLEPLDKHSENLTRFLIYIGKPRPTRWHLKQYPVGLMQVLYFLFRCDCFNPRTIC